MSEFTQVFIQQGDKTTFLGDFDAIQVRDMHRAVLYGRCQCGHIHLQSLVESNEELHGLDKALENVASCK
jgi:hypothetical protein